MTIFREIFSILYIIMLRCVYLLESSHQGDSNDYTQHTFHDKKKEKKSLNICFLELLEEFRRNSKTSSN